jgi:ribonuclease HII
MQLLNGRNSMNANQQPRLYMSLTGETVGVDEVGRGPLIGDVVAAAVILPAGCLLPLRDSKKLSETKRETLAILIKEQAIAYAIAVASPQEIDEINILQATMLAMRRAVQQLQDKSAKISYLYVDGNRCPELSCGCEAVIKGDDKIMEISAASILAKVYRDQQMRELHEIYPQYGFNQHKGYPTVKHLAAINEFGVIAGYRKSFKPIKQILQAD